MKVVPPGIEVVRIFGSKFGVQLLLTTSSPPVNVGYHV